VRASDPETLPAETGAALHGQVVLRHTPPADFPLQQATQVLAFLIRNRGKLDNEVVQQKWRHLDRISLPLAVYLRDVEARDEWSVIEKEVSSTPLSPEQASGHRGIRCTSRHRKLMDAAQEWQRRGQELLTLIESEEVATAEGDEVVPSEENGSRPKP
jgi:hypothetical protein